MRDLVPGRPPPAAPAPAATRWAGLAPRPTPCSTATAPLAQEQLVGKQGLHVPRPEPTGLFPLAWTQAAVAVSGERWSYFSRAKEGNCLLMSPGRGTSRPAWSLREQRPCQQLLVAGKVGHLTEQVLGLAGSQVLARDLVPHVYRAGRDFKCSDNVAGPKGEGKGRPGGRKGCRRPGPRAGLQSLEAGPARCLLPEVNPLRQSHPSPHLSADLRTCPQRPLPWHPQPAGRRHHWPGASQLPAPRHPGPSRALMPHTQAGRLLCGHPGDCGPGPASVLTR